MLRLPKLRFEFFMPRHLSLVNLSIALGLDASKVKVIGLGPGVLTIGIQGLRNVNFTPSTLDYPEGEVVVLRPCAWTEPTCLIVGAAPEHRMPVDEVAMG